MNRRAERSADRAATTARGAGTGLTLLGWALGAQVWVHHPEVATAVRCDEVTLRLSSWAGDPDNPAIPQNKLPSTRTNPEINVRLSIDEQALPVSYGARAASVQVDAAVTWARGAWPDQPVATPPFQAPECGAPAMRVSDSADQPAVHLLLLPGARPASDAVGDPTSLSDAPGNGVRLLPWLAGAALVGAMGRLLHNLLRRRSRAPVVTR